MNTMKHLRRIEEFSNPYLNHFVEKVGVSKRRSTKFSSNGYNGKRIHWINRTGAFKDEKFRKGPKYWHGQKPIRIDNPIKSYQDLIIAIKLITSGDRCYNDYKGIFRINRDRLRLAQSWKDRSLNYNISDIVGLNRSEIKRNFRPGKHGFARAYL